MRTDKSNPLYNFYGYGYRLSKNKEIAKELVHDAWIKAVTYSGLAPDLSNEAFRKYFMTAIKTAHVDKLRRKYRQTASNRDVRAMFYRPQENTRTWEALHDFDKILTKMNNGRKADNRFVKALCLAYEHPGYVSKRFLHKEIALTENKFKETLAMARASAQILYKGGV